MSRFTGAEAFSVELRWPQDPNSYTQNLIQFLAEGEGGEPSRARSSTGFQPGPVTHRLALPRSSPTRI